MSSSVTRLLKRRNVYGDIELDYFEKAKESTTVYGSNAKCWFGFNDGRVLFKTYDNELEAYGEILYSKAAKKYGINCAEYDFASYKDEQGTISYDLAYNNGLVAIDGMTVFARYNPDRLPDIIRRNIHSIDVISMFNKKYNNYEQFSKVFEERFPENVKELQQEMIRTFILDVLLDHVDKNLWNILLVSDVYGNNPHFTSIDSSHIACLYRGKHYIKEAVNSLLAGDGSITIEDYLSGGVYGYDVDVKDRDYNPCKDLIDFYYGCDDNQREEIAKFVKSIDISDILEELRKIKKMDPIVNTWINAVVSARKGFLLKKFYHINDNYKSEHNNKNFHLRKNNKR